MSEMPTQNRPEAPQYPPAAVDDFDTKAVIARSRQIMAQRAASFDVGMYAPAPCPNPSGYQPVERKVLIEPKPVEDKIGSIILPDSEKDKQEFAQMEGVIIAASPLAFDYATPAEYEAVNAVKPKAGDRVLYAKYAGFTVKGKDGKEYRVINDQDICATVSE